VVGGPWHRLRRRLLGGDGAWTVAAVSSLRLTRGPPWRVRTSLEGGAAFPEGCTTSLHDRRGLPQCAQADVPSAAASSPVAFLAAPRKKKKLKSGVHSSARGNKVRNVCMDDMCIRITFYFKSHSRLTKRSSTFHIEAFSQLLFHIPRPTTPLYSIEHL
jgi:hypothetical protein